MTESVAIKNIVVDRIDFIASSLSKSIRLVLYYKDILRKKYDSIHSHLMQQENSKGALPLGRGPARPKAKPAQGHAGGRIRGERPLTIEFLKG